MEIAGPHADKFVFGTLHFHRSRLLWCQMQAAFPMTVAWSIVITMNDAAMVDWDPSYSLPGNVSMKDNISTHKNSCIIGGRIATYLERYLSHTRYMVHVEFYLAKVLLRGDGQARGECLQIREPRKYSKHQRDNNFITYIRYMRTIPTEA